MKFGPHFSITRMGRALGLTFICVVQLQAAAVHEAEAIQHLLTTLHDRGEFTGSILVAREGKILYRDAFGDAIHSSSELLATPANIASLTKPFTAMAVMILAAQHRLEYDDQIAPFLPQLGDAAAGITIRHLLTHTSGIPDVGDLGIDHPDLREREVVDAVRQQHSQFARPGRKYRYSNTGYMLLAMIVEKISGLHFGDFLTSAVFRPLDLQHTSFAERSTSAGRTKGDGGILSTVDDLLKWDQALATGKLVTKAALAEAFTPAQVEEGPSSYGFGWNITPKDGDTYVWHTGNSGGTRAFIGRRLEEKITIIILTYGDSHRMEIADAIVNILHGQPYTMPKFSIGREMLAVLRQRGVAAALERYHALRATDESGYDFSERELNSLGYQLLERGDMMDAIRIFELNTEQYPASSNAFDSLGDACLQGGQKARAILAYRKAVQLDAANLNAQKMLQKLE